MIELPNIGPVLFEKSQRAKHISISVKAPSKVRVAIPRRISFKDAVSFAATKQSWILKNLDKVKNRYDNQKKNPIGDIDAAKDYLLNRLNKLAIKNGFTYNKATIRNQKTRWGSCSQNNNISLNIQLINLPVDLIDYVILHELVHTEVKNHSDRFWKTLDRYVENSKKQNIRLRLYCL